MTDFIINDVVYINNKKHYNCTCGVCGNKKTVRANRYDNSKCICIAHQSPDLIKYLYNEEDKYKFSSSSTKNVKWKCDNCGNIFEKKPRDAKKNGVICPVCSDKISYPNRFMFSFLSYYGVDFENEKSFNWSNRRRYDFYIPLWNMIIEMNGEQHYTVKDNSIFCKDIEKIDKIKKENALKNGINYYIEINSSKSEAVYIFNNIKNSKLSEFIDIKDESCFHIQKQTENKLFNEVIKLRNEGLYTTTIAERLKKSVDTIANIIKVGKELSLCEYDADVEQKKFIYVAHETNKKPVICITTGKEFESINEASKFYGLNPKALSNCLVGRSKSSGIDKETNQKLYWKFRKEN